MVVVALACGSGVVGAQLKREAPKSLTDAEFWSMFTSMSEPSGMFPSENFVSNEMNFQEPIPTLQGRTTAGGAYLGVGPEQNFTYIANLHPRMAIIVDIRRQNAILHLMYKALFEESRTRAEFVARLFSRPAVARMTTSATAPQLFDSAAVSPATDSAFQANLAAIERRLLVTHGFTLDPNDVAMVEHVYTVFYQSGTDVNYASRAGMPGFRASYATYDMLQSATNADSVPMAYLSSEANYRAIKDMEERNLIVPVVGDFAGPKAIRAVGQYLDQRGLSVSAFYLSNVEQYLFQNGVSEGFYRNVATLPIDTASQFIRSVPRYGAGMVGGSYITFGTPGIAAFGAGGFTSSGVTSVRVIDSLGTRVMRLTYDSAGQPITRTVTVDSLLRRDSLGVAARGAGGVGAGSAIARPAFGMSRMNVSSTLTSGIASIQETLAAFTAGKAMTYAEIIAMTKTSGWK